MTNVPGPLVRCWVEELRHTIALRARRRRRLAIGALAGVTILPLAVTMAWRPPVLLVWNASASAPIGLYHVRSGEPLHRGDMVVAWIPRPARRFAAARHYLPSNVPLVKWIAAVAGDDICASGRQLSINGQFATPRLGLDPIGRPMPGWNRCRRLGDGEFLLLARHPHSFDGRYFGATQQADIVGRASLIWPWRAKEANDG